jgi:Delta7-sterol 5-desaturase
MVFKDILRSLAILLLFFVVSCSFFFGSTFFYKIKFPLPQDTQSFNSNDAPEDLSALIGEWQGVWDDGYGKFFSLMGYSTDALLIINEILPHPTNPQAKIIYSVGNENSPAPNIFFADKRKTPLSKGWIEQIVNIERTPLPRLSWSQGNERLEFSFNNESKLFQGNFYRDGLLISSIKLKKSRLTTDLEEGLGFLKAHVEHILQKVLFSGRQFLFMAGVPFFVIWVWRKKAWVSRRIQKRFPTKADIRREISHALVNLFTVSVITTFAFYLWARGLTSIYPNVADYGWTYFFLSIVIAFLCLDTYFYWAHRFLHLPKIYRLAHHLHHQSIAPSPWSTVAIAPLEQLMMSSFYIVFLCFVPMHFYAYFTFILISAARSTIGHLGYELFPAGFLKGPFKWFTTVTHHEMHHQYFNSNYGLYFNWWDKWMNTNHEDYEKVFERVTESQDKHIEKQITEEQVVANP